MLLLIPPRYGELEVVGCNGLFLSIEVECARYSGPSQLPDLHPQVDIELIHRGGDATVEIVENYAAIPLGTCVAI
jgi:hypothetical protein